MELTLNPRHLKQYRDIAWLLVKHGRSDMVKHAGLHHLAPEKELVESPEAESAAQSLATDLEKLGPTFIKLGQLLSTRPDLLPVTYLEALSRLQDRVEPFSFAEVEETISKELGIRISKAFDEFEAEPMAAASLGQVHHARLRDGREVAVKVQRPNIREKIATDLEALTEVAEFLDRNTAMGKKYEFRAMVEELRKSLLGELDYRQEARHLAVISDNLAEFKRIVVPRPIFDYTSSRVLTMEYIQGHKITAVGPLRHLEIDGYELADQLFCAYLKQILVDGFFHADPHPGNVFLTQANHIALLDLGMVARVTLRTQEHLLQLLLAVSEGRGDSAAWLATTMGEKREEFDESRFRRRVAELVAEHKDARLGDLNIGRTILEVKKITGDCGLSMPPELTLIGKAMLNLDAIGRTLAPHFDPNEAIRRYAFSIVQQRVKSSFSLGNIFSNLLEAKDVIERLPGRINTILERVANNDIEVKVDAIDERSLIEGLQKIANRITMGLVLAALIVGAALLMNVPTSFRILGYPGLAIIFFLLAAGGGLVLVFNILFSDIKAKKK